MKAEIQNQLWAILPKEARVEVKVAYGIDTINKHFDNSYNTALIDIFGLHNLTSDTKPEEMLMVKRSTVQRLYASTQKIADLTSKSFIEGKLYAYTELFGDKCLPDKEEPKPKFKVGDIVIAKTWIGEQSPQKIVMVENGVAYFEKGNPAPIADLESYTEESVSQNSSANCDKENLNSKSENMGEKELNLCELLKGCEGQTFYCSLIDKDVVLMQMLATGTMDVSFGNSTLILQDGRDEEGNLLLFPSKENRNWMEWKEAQKSRTF